MAWPCRLARANRRLRAVKVACTRSRVKRGIAELFPDLRYCAGRAGPAAAMLRASCSSGLSAVGAEAFTSCP